MSSYSILPLAQWISNKYLVDPTGPENNPLHAKDYVLDLLGQQIKKELFTING